MSAPHDIGPPAGRAGPAATGLERLLALVADWRAGDPDAAAARFAPDAVWHFAAGSRPPATGRPAIRTVLAAYGRMQAENRFRVTAHAESGAALFYEGVEDFDTPAGHRVAVPCAGVLTFDAEGRITGWRDYYDRATMEAQLAGTQAPASFCADLWDRPTPEAGVPDAGPRDAIAPVPAIRTVITPGTPRPAGPPTPVD